MKITLGHAKNDIFELTLGIVLNVIGGIFIGYIYENPLWYQALFAAIIFLIAGVVLEIRVLAKHHFGLQRVRTGIDKARIQNSETLEKMKEQQNVVESATNELEAARREIEKAKNEISEI